MMSNKPITFFAKFDTAFSLIKCSENFNKHFDAKFIDAFAEMIKDEASKNTLPFLAYSTVLIIDKYKTFHVYVIGDAEDVGYFVKLLPGKSEGQNNYPSPVCAE